MGKGLGAGWKLELRLLLLLLLAPLDLNPLYNVASAGCFSLCKRLGINGTPGGQRRVEVGKGREAW